jgi:hypothetical protein
MLDFPRAFGVAINLLGVVMRDAFDDLVEQIDELGGGLVVEAAG